MSHARPRRLLRLLRVTGLLCVVAGLALPASPASARPVPPDPNAHGFIGLCDNHNRIVTSGSVHAAPFVWKAVATQPPPKLYRGRGANAVLNIYQPRPQVDAAEWSGDQLTSATFYKTQQAPSTQATLKDIPLSVVVNEFPPMVDGLYQLRMYFGNTRVGLYSATYPSTFIRVEGDRWTVVSGGTVNCAASSGESNEVLSGAVPPKVAYGSATPLPAHGQPANKPSKPSDARPKTVEPTGSQSPVANASSSVSRQPPSEQTVGEVGSSNNNSSTAAWWVAGLAVAIAAVAGVAWWRSRRQN